MAKSSYEVEAKLELKRAAQTQRTLNNLSNTLKTLHTGFGTANDRLSSLVRNLVIAGGTYVGLRALSGAIRAIASSSLTANTNVEDMTTSLATLMASVERISFSRATASAGGLFEKLNDIAVQSPATATELMNIFRGVYGPLRNAGAGMEELLNFSKNAAAVGAALQVDYEQLSRDIAGMATGVAGLDNKTFRLLRSMGLITESTEDWNKMATEDSAAAAERLLSVFDQLGGPSAEAFGRTWTGVSSTFRGIIQQMQRVLTGPAFRVVTNNLKKVNDFLLRYRTNIENVLKHFGRTFASKLQRVFDFVGEKFEYVLKNIDQIAEKLDTTFNAALGKFNELKPLVMGVGKFLLIAKVLSLVLVPLVSLLSGLGGAISSAMGALGFGGAAAGAGAGAGVGAGAGAGIGASLAALAASLAPVVAVIGTLVGVATALYLGLKKFWEEIVIAWTATTDWSFVMGNVLEDLKIFGAGMWAMLKPPLEALGGVLIHTGITVLKLFFGLLSALSPLLRALGVAMKWLGDNAVEPLTTAIAELVGMIMFAFGELGTMMTWVGDTLRLAVERFTSFFGGEATRGWGQEANKQTSESKQQTNEARTQTGIFQNMLNELRGIGSQAQGSTMGFGGDRTNMRPFERLFLGGTGGREPGVRQNVNIDMRGTRVTINQEFRDADPDNVMVQTREAFEREALSRTQSGFVSPFTR
jgi:hypothetical protein